jgi:hypothetical protein
MQRRVFQAFSIGPVTQPQLNQKLLSPGLEAAPSLFSQVLDGLVPTVSSTSSISRFFFASLIPFGEAK